MSRPVIVRPLAEQDLVEAQTWYEEKRAGLGSEFRAAVDAAFQRLSESPLLYPSVYRQLRRAVLRRFPYLIYFRVDADRVVVVACLHSRRHPRVVRARIP